ncbi:Phosphoribosylamine--glycine ligase [Candidatus Providencia siddallii]|uniref:Phosphoribosylamine--glycine ligase n=1 Tax=Candidatus Providencia siddallii TaxID=1715285 RepID=A0A0M6WAM7_9GAMM|nr:Phosphoribosylamine--glycine ligase [Candidatus Providencia siddallii]
MNILIIGSGGREHAIAWKISKSLLTNKIYIAPGNAGTELEPALNNVNISIIDIDKLLSFAKKKCIDLTIVGPETPLVIGIVDAFKKANLTIFGPNQRAAQIEGSKSFAKDFLVRNNIPTANYKSFTEIKSALNYIKNINMPIVIKADGLASGKGVIITKTLEKAKTIILNMLSGNLFGNAGKCIIIEEFLEGEEVSFTVMVDGENIIPLATSQDYKRVGDGDTGANTGGMGACSPALIVNKIIHQRIMEEIIEPTVKYMNQEGNNYQGFLYAGIIIDKLGNPKVIEFNCRLGDPETQPIMLRLQSDFLSLCIAGATGNLKKKIPLWNKQTALGVIMATKNYPGNYNKSNIIHGLPIKETFDTKIFYANTIIKNNKIITSGGRVICVTTLGENIIQAQKKAYEITKKIFWKNSFYRYDIGYRDASRLK